MKTNNNLLNWAIGIGLLFPLFFQLSGGIYDGFLNDSGGNLVTLPLPVAVLVCFGGIALLLKRLRQACVAWIFLAAMILVLLASVLFANPELRIEIRKLILLAQFVMPMFALPLGRMINDDKVVPEAFLVVLLAVVPAQLLAGWLQGTLTLTHSLYVFSIYQHFQFVPPVFVCAFAYATVALWDTHRKWLLFLFPWMSIYVIASVSFLTIAAFIVFAAAFTGLRLRAAKKIRGPRLAAITLAGIALMTAGIGAYYEVARNKSSIVGDGGRYIAKFYSLSEGKLPINVSERLADWTLFGSGIIETPRTMVFGHVAPLAREVRSSAHNWYIDIAYSFGLISLLPVLLLIGYTASSYWRSRRSLSIETKWLALVVLFLVVIDSNFKVTLRQPYPGIFAYFMWGLLLSHLHASCRTFPRANLSK
jgi:hypothetical protein